MMQWVARGYFYSSQNPFYQELLHSLLTTFFHHWKGQVAVFWNSFPNQRPTTEMPKTSNICAQLLISCPWVDLNFSMVANHWSNDVMEKSIAEAYPKKRDLLIFDCWIGLNFSMVTNHWMVTIYGWSLPPKHDLLIFGRWAGLNFSLLSLLEPVGSHPIPGPVQQWYHRLNPTIVLLSSLKSLALLGLEEKL